MHNDNQNRSGLGLLRYIWTEWISTFVVLILLLLTLVIGTGEMIHGQLLRMGERLYGDPATGMQYSFCVLNRKHHNVIVILMSIKSSGADESRCRR